METQIMHSDLAVTTAVKGLQELAVSLSELARNSGPLFFEELLIHVGVCLR